MSARHSKPYKTINSTLSQPQQTLYLKSCIFCSPTAGFRVKFIFSSLSARLTELMFANQRFYEARSQEGKFINLLQNINTFFLCFTSRVWNCFISIECCWGIHVSDDTRYKGLLHWTIWTISPPESITSPARWPAEAPDCHIIAVLHLQFSSVQGKLGDCS